MNKPAFLFFLLLLIALPAQAHHTKEHVLGAPAAPVIAANPDAAKSSNSNFWLALGPFFVLVGLGALRWSYRRHRERRMDDTRTRP